VPVPDDAMMGETKRGENLLEVFFFFKKKKERHTSTLGNGAKQNEANVCGKVG
jgi:hypothetical protein